MPSVTFTRSALPLLMRVTVGDAPVSSMADAGMTIAWRD